MSSINPIVGVSLCISALGAGLAYLAYTNQDTNDTLYNEVDNDEAGDNVSNKNIILKNNDEIKEKVEKESQEEAQKESQEEDKKNTQEEAQKESQKNTQEEDPKENNEQTVEQTIEQVVAEEIKDQQLRTNMQKFLQETYDKINNQ